MLENGNLYIVMDYCEAGNYATGCYNMIIYKWTVYFRSFDGQLNKCRWRFFIPVLVRTWMWPFSPVVKGNKNIFRFD